MGRKQEVTMKVDLVEAKKMIKQLVSRNAPSGGADGVELLQLLNQATKEMALHAGAIENVNCWLLKLRSLPEQAKADTKLLLDTLEIQDQHIVEDDGNYSMETCTTFLEGAVSVRHLYRRVPTEDGQLQMLYTVSFLLPDEDGNWSRICGARIVEGHTAEDRQVGVMIDQEELDALHQALAPTLPLIAFFKVLVSMGFFEDGAEMDKAVIAKAKEQFSALDQAKKEQEEEEVEEQEEEEEEEPAPAEDQSEASPDASPMGIKSPTNGIDPVHNIEDM